MPASSGPMIYHFNSSMVQLKASQASGLVQLKQFQFLYGTIKSIHRRFTISYVFLFQFLYGTIKSQFP